MNNCTCDLTVCIPVTPNPPEIHCVICGGAISVAKFSEWQARQRALWAEAQEETEPDQGEDHITMLNHLFFLASNESAISGRVAVMENLLRYAVLRLPEAEQQIAQEIMHIIGVGPIVAPENAEEGYQGEGTEANDQEENTNS